MDGVSVADEARRGQEEDGSARRSEQEESGSKTTENDSSTIVNDSSTIVNDSKKEDSDSKKEKSDSRKDSRKEESEFRKEESGSRKLLSGSRKEEFNVVQSANDPPIDAPIDIAIRQFVFLPPDEVIFPLINLFHESFLTRFLIGNTCCCCVTSERKYKGN